jgi:hypothetical protein
VERWLRARITSLAGRAGFALRTHRSSRADIAALAVGPLTPVRTLQALGSWLTGRPRRTHLPFVAAGDDERRDDSYRSRQLVNHRHNYFARAQDRIAYELKPFSDGRTAALFQDTLTFRIVGSEGMNFAIEATFGRHSLSA